jgi:hypothetical protein
VLTVLGGQSWWSSFTGRFKAQQALGFHAEGWRGWEQGLSRTVGALCCGGGR